MDRARACHGSPRGLRVRKISRRRRLYIAVPRTQLLDHSAVCRALGPFPLITQSGQFILIQTLHHATIVLSTTSHAREEGSHHIYTEMIKHFFNRVPAILFINIFYSFTFVCLITSETHTLHAGLLSTSLSIREVENMYIAECYE